jgi:phage gpG-like protein
VAEVVVKVDASKVTLALAQFRLGIEQRAELMQTLGAGQLKSIYQTFDEQGSPAGSWRGLSFSSKGWMKRKYSAGHKLLIDTGHMRNSIGSVASGDTVTLGTNVKYAKWQQFGWTGTQQVRDYTYAGRMGLGRMITTNKLGRKQTVTRKIAGPGVPIHVKAHKRLISIPARPFLVFRPEDPQRISEEVSLFLVERARQAGLEAN